MAPDSALVAVDPPDSAAAPAPQVTEVQPPPIIETLPAPAEPAPKPAKPQDPPGSEGPVLTVRLSPTQEAELEARFRTDIRRAAEAVGLVRQKPLTRKQTDDLSLVEEFMRSAEAARPKDLMRAGTLAEKARVLAEELKSAVVK